MKFSSENLLAQLDNPEIINWALELKNGKDAYAFLMQAVGGAQMNVNQTLNGLHALFRIRDHGNRTDVLQKFIDLAMHPNKEIRSEAVQLAIGLVRFSIKRENVPLLLSDEQEKALRMAMAQGLTDKVSQLAGDFFAL